MVRVLSARQGYLQHMTVDVALFAYLSEYQPDGEGGRRPRAVRAARGHDRRRPHRTLGLPDEPRIVFIGGKHAPEDTVLSDGDRLAIFPPVAGG